jgi:hypothetical protein
MAKISNKLLLLLLIFVFSFVYRVMLMLWSGFPSGADIGLHNSIIYSIINQGNTDFLWNFYQIGGGLSLTFPGYHIYTAMIMMLTGMPDYLAHTMGVALLSSATVLASYMLTKALWSEPVAFIVAFLVAISRFDIESLLWAGYPNVAALLLIPLLFALLLQPARFSKKTYLAVTSVLAGSLFLTHSLSVVIFVTTAIGTIFLALIFSKKIDFPRRNLLNWFLPMVFGAVLVLPFLVQIVPAYLSDYGGGAGGSEAIKLALLSQKIIPLYIVLPLFLCIPAVLIFSKIYHGRFKNFFTLWMFVWIFIPTAATQCYLFHLYIDYNRFLYFLILPVIMVTALLIDHVSTFIASAISKSVAQQKIAYKFQSDYGKLAARIIPRITKKNVYAMSLLAILLFAFFAIPLFVTPATGVGVSVFYQTVNKANYEGIQWIRDNTPVGSVIVADANYGWWLSGFAQRPTLSAVPPEYLTLTREFKPAETARYLLDSDYVIDNGLIQVREDGGYIGRHNPMISSKIEGDYYPYAFYNFNSQSTWVYFYNGTADDLTSLLDIPVKNMQVINGSDSVTVSVERENQFFNLTQQTTVYQGCRFVNITVAFNSTVAGVYLTDIDFQIESKDYCYRYPEDQPINGSLSFFDPGTRVIGQIIFTQEQPTDKNPQSSNPYVLDYSFNRAVSGKVEMFATAYQLSNEETPHMDEILVNNLSTYTQKVADYSIDVFDYQQAIIENNISYIAIRDLGVLPKFFKDPQFTQVFINEAVAILSTNRC